MSFQPTLLPLREQAELRNTWLRERLATLLPELMARAELDMWLVIAREYNEDPVVMTLLPEPEMSARRRTILVFARTEAGKIERITLSRYGYGDVYTAAWNPDQEEQYACLARIIAERDPQRIGINRSTTFAFGDGLSSSEYERLLEALGATYAPRLVSAEAMAIGWLERRIPAELAIYPQLVAIGHQLITTAFSREVITPGVTTTADVVWWMRQAMHDAGLQAWFQPTISIQAPGQSFEASEPRTVIQPGDLLHCDVGFVYLGLCTDQQQHAYVLRDGETAAPTGLNMALAAGNQLQDMLLDTMRPGLSGNEVLRIARERALAAGLTPSIYTHPLGYHGHAAGPTIGLWDRQDGVPGAGDYPLFDQTVYSIELNAITPVPEWGNQPVRMALEEDALLHDGSMHWLNGRQTQLHLI